MKKLIYFFACSLLGLNAQAQTSPFAREVWPSFGNTSIKFNPEYADAKLIDILAISGDCTVYDKASNTFSPMKGSISSVIAIKNGTLSSEQDSSVTVYASFDKNEKNEFLGDGGGVVFFKIKRQTKGNWALTPVTKIGKRLVYYQNVDFSPIGGTIYNTDFIGFRTNFDPSTNNFIVAEDYTKIKSNKDLIGLEDTSDYEFPASLTLEGNFNSYIPANTSLSKHMSLGWPVEITGTTGEVLNKVYRLGRGASNITKGQYATYFVYPGNPSVLMQYVPPTSPLKDFTTFENPENGTSAIPQLYAYKQNEDGTGAFSVPIAFKVDSIDNPFEPDPKYKIAEVTPLFDSLVVAKEVALRAGATMFANIGDIAVTTDQMENQVILITEKGIDDSGDDYKNTGKKFNGTLANHLQALDAKDGNTDGNFKDPYGRVLALQFGSGSNAKLSIFTEGGTSDGEKFFSNPDKIDIYEDVDQPSYLSVATICIKENIPATDLGRNPSGTPFSERTNEAYYFQAAAESNYPAFLAVTGTREIAPRPISDYKLFATGSKGSMLSASSDFTEYGNLFLQNSKADPMFFDTYLTVVNGYNGTDKSMIVALNGINTDFNVGLLSDPNNNSKGFAAWPNPSTGLIQVKENSNYSVSDVSGNQVKTFENTQLLDLSDLSKGMYFIKNTNGAVKKIVLQ